MQIVNLLVNFAVARKIYFFRNYFIDFYDDQSGKIQEKIEYVLDLIRFEDRVPIKFLKYLVGTDGIYEIRIITRFKNIRILCFFDKNELVILMNCFIKKSQKIPKREIRLAENIKKEYLEQKYGK